MGTYEFDRGGADPGKLTDPRWYFTICENADHPGHGLIMIECERKVRRLEQGGGVGQWLLSVKADHNDG